MDFNFFRSYDRRFRKFELKLVPLIPLDESVLKFFDLNVFHAENFEREKKFLVLEFYLCPMVYK